MIKFFIVNTMRSHFLKIIATQDKEGAYALRNLAAHPQYSPLPGSPSSIQSITWQPIVCIPGLEVQRRLVKPLPGRCQPLETQETATVLQAGAVLGTFACLSVLYTALFDYMF